MLKRILCFVCFVFIAFVVHAESISMQWLNEDGTTYDTTTCTAGDDVILPTAPTKRGYTFMGWHTYTPIQYIKSSGTQYIDTGIKVNSDYTVEAMGAFGCGAPVFGQDGNNYNSIGGFVLFISCSSGGSFWGNSNNNNSTSNALGVSSSSYNTLKIDKNGVYTNGIKKISFTVPSTIKYSTNNLFLFATRTTYGWSHNTLLYVKIWDENKVLVSDFIPVLDENDIPCMFDKVSGQFFYNAGTGDFIAGPVISQ